MNSLVFGKLASFLRNIFKRKKDVKIGLYGPVNSGKTTLANKICMDWLGEEMGKVSVIPHETREIQMKEKVEMKHDNKSLTFNLVDTPGIATKIDFEDFVRSGLKKKAAKKRAKEATRGVIEAIKWLNDMDLVMVVLDSKEDPINQVNITILGNLDARNIPVLVVSNKTDLKNTNTAAIRNTFPKYSTVAVSAKHGHNMDELYSKLFDMLK